MIAVTLDRLRDWLRRSRIAHGLAVYLPVCWICLQVVSTFIDRLGLPGWVFSGTLLLLIVGLVVVVGAARRAERAEAEPAPAETTHAGLAPPWRRWWARRNVVAGGAAVLALWALTAGGYMGLRASGLGPFATLTSAGAFESSDQVLVASFTNRTREPGLGETVAEALAVDLSQSRLVRVVDARATAAALKRMKKPADAPLTPELARELAQREGLAAVLEGEVSALGPATVVSARLVSPADGTVLADCRERAKTPEALLAAVDRASGELRNKIGESLRVLRAEPPLEQVTTASLPALRLYTEGKRASNAAQHAEAALLYEQAIELDPEFATAWRALGTALDNVKLEPARALRAYIRAYELRARLPERERGLTVAAYYATVVDDPDRAEAAYRIVLETYPKDTTALNNLAILRSAAYDNAEAERLYRRSLQIDPSRVAAHMNLVMALIAQRKFEEARTITGAAKQRFPKSPRLDTAALLIAATEGDFTRADRIAGELEARHPEAYDVLTSVHFYRAASESVRGRLRAAEAALTAMAEEDASQGSPASALATMTEGVAMYAMHGELAAGRAVLERALERWPMESIPAADRPYHALAEAYARLGEAAAARRLLAQARAFPEPRPGYPVGDAVAGLLALAENRPSQAAARLKVAAARGQGAFSWLPELARAQAAAGRTELAIATFERYVALPRAFKPEQSLAHEQLGALYMSSGAPQASMRHAQALERLWAEADAPLRGRARFAQARASRLARAGASPPA